jgi:hypothetical protein
VLVAAFESGELQRMSSRNGNARSIVAREQMLAKLLQSMAD